MSLPNRLNILEIQKDGRGPRLLLNYQIPDPTPEINELYTELNRKPESFKNEVFDSEVPEPPEIAESFESVMSIMYSLYIQERMRVSFERDDNIILKEMNHFKRFNDAWNDFVAYVDKIYKTEDGNDDIKRLISAVALRLNEILGVKNISSWNIEIVKEAEYYSNAIILLPHFSSIEQTQLLYQAYYVLCDFRDDLKENEETETLRKMCLVFVNRFKESMFEAVVRNIFKNEEESFLLAITARLRKIVGMKFGLKSFLGYKVSDEEKEWWNQFEKEFYWTFLNIFFTPKMAAEYIATEINLMKSYDKEAVCRSIYQEIDRDSFNSVKKEHAFIFSDEGKQRIAGIRAEGVMLLLKKVEIVSSEGEGNMKLKETEDVSRRKKREGNKRKMIVAKGKSRFGTDDRGIKEKQSIREILKLLFRRIGEEFHPPLFKAFFFWIAGG